MLTDEQSTDHKKENSNRITPTIKKQNQKQLIFAKEKKIALLINKKSRQKSSKALEMYKIKDSRALAV